ncbi:integrase [Mesorhizobium sp. LNHC221B00]|nr:integrase [Mesorhizobium sp. LNHC221B00]
MNRTIKDATVKRFYYESHDHLRQHLADFVSAYNFGRRLKTLKEYSAQPGQRDRTIQARSDHQTLELIIWSGAKAIL